MVGVDQDNAPKACDRESSQLLKGRFAKTGENPLRAVSEKARRPGHPVTDGFERVRVCGSIRVEPRDNNPVPKFGAVFILNTARTDKAEDRAGSFDRRILWQAKKQVKNICSRNSTASDIPVPM